MSESVCVLGATGSIGQNTLDVIRQHPQRWQVTALTANANVVDMLALCKEFRPEYAVMCDTTAAATLSSECKSIALPTQVLAGEEALVQVAALDQVDTVMAAIVGGAGLASSLAAANAGKKVLLANKESLVMSGQLFMDAVAASNAQLLPIDSEHNAIFQCMPSNYLAGQAAKTVERILLTGSGGPFREMPLEQLQDVTPEQACKHPNWSMGAKISVDSATMMNKGLELIEAAWLFNTAVEDVEIVVHPQSVIHSMVQYNDGSVLAQLGNPDMRTPIAYGLAWPDRVSAGVRPLNLIEVANLSFEKPDFERFPCLRLATDAALAGGSFSCVLNAANEVAVDAFLQQRIAFTDIARIVEDCLNIGNSVELSSIDAVLEVDTAARAHAKQCLVATQV
ncbi:MAG: 1-deoxy-D-xylulose-5-phosphate reductoisomerase [Pseudomonadales bacterium]